jgi:hypothetical protein
MGARWKAVRKGKARDLLQQSRYAPHILAGPAMGSSCPAQILEQQQRERRIVEAKETRHEGRRNARIDAVLGTQPAVGVVVGGELGKQRAPIGERDHPALAAV